MTIKSYSIVIQSVSRCIYIWGVGYFSKYQSVKPPTTLLYTRGKFQHFHFYAVNCKNIHSIFVQIFLVDLVVAVATVANHPCKWLGLLGGDVVTACTNCTCCTFTAQMGNDTTSQSNTLKTAQNGSKWLKMGVKNNHLVTYQMVT